MENIDSFINLNDNIKFSKLDNKSKIRLINLIMNNDLTYRNILNIDPNITFGIEVEFEEKFEDMHNGFLNIRELLDFISLFGLDKEDFNLVNSSNAVYDYTKNTITYDGSLINGYEIDSKVLKNSKLTWFNLGKLLDVLNDHFVIKESCGAHVHVDFNVLRNNNTYLKNFIRLWRTYENIIYRFAAGEYTNFRQDCFHYAKPRYETFDLLLNSEIDELCIFDDDYNSDIREKFTGVNFLHVNGLRKQNTINTIEFRIANGSLNKIIWQNLVNLYIHLLTYSVNINYDLDTIEKRDLFVRRLKKDELNYRLIYIEQALELADLIFNNNLDKIYFLKQYLKDGTENYSDNLELVLSKKFTK